MEIEQHLWGFTPEGEAIVRYTMRNASGAEAVFTNMGAALVAVRVPDRWGELGDVVLGYPGPEGYVRERASMGKSIGRFAGRIARGCFTLDGRAYKLPLNLPPHHMHGGEKGFGNRLWEGRIETNRVVFSLESADGDQGYPGNLDVEAVYDWDDDCSLEMTWLARSDAPTIVNMTNHTYFNLAGADNRSVLGHRLRLNASRVLACDAGQIPTGELSAVEGTPFDFRTERPLEEGIGGEGVEQGYDHTFCIDGWREHILGEVGELSDPVSGRRMRIFSSQPAVQLYTGNGLQGGEPGLGGVPYDNHTGVALECQGFPDAPNHPAFPSAVLREGETYIQKAVYRFSVDT